MEAIIFCGVQATGKTTFYIQNFFRTHIRISMDQLNTRNKENLFLETCLISQQRFVVDNTNPTRAERRKYIAAAKAKKFKVIGYYFKSSIESAIQRNELRTGKENIPEKGIWGTLNRLEIPAKEEGFDELYSVEIEGNNFVIRNWENT